MVLGAQTRTDPRIHYAVSRFFASRLRVLVVTDGCTRFEHLADAPLGKALGIGRSDWSHLEFEVTTAHRGCGAADHACFRFDSHDLDRYDQIWVWRANPMNGEPLSPAEVSALSAFLDRGGRIYAARK